MGKLENWENWENCETGKTVKLEKLENRKCPSLSLLTELFLIFFGVVRRHVFIALQRETWKMDKNREDSGEA